MYSGHVEKLLLKLSNRVLFQLYGRKKSNYSNFKFPFLKFCMPATIWAYEICKQVVRDLSHLGSS